jgi:CRP/FNR family transcriptional regulator, nitrogen oxide reductase regulator
VATRPISAKSKDPVVNLPAPFSRSRLLEGLTKPELELVLSSATQRRFGPKSLLTHQEDPARHVGMLTKGAARHFYVSTLGRKVLLRWLLPGDVFGGKAFLREPSTYLFGTETLKESSVLLWSRTTIREMATRCPRLWDNALSIACDYLTWFLSAHMALISNDSRERLANVLLSLTEGMGRSTGDGTELEITNEELGNAANVNPFTVSRLLSEWRRNGALSKGRGKIVLLSAERLSLA